MGYILKQKKGIKMQSGRKSRGGALRTYGNRAVVFDTKKQASNAKTKIVNRWVKSGKLPKTKKQAMKNRIVIKKV